ncbi:MAG: hypothetical protein JNM69_20030 [Archangium sp.]|nr:hypothetical protein [Archangium sp.]
MSRWLIITFLLAGCGPPVTTVPDAGQWFDDDFAGCRIGGTAPQSVDDVIARINALPMPVSVACFTASLPRPLSLVATSSRFSAQPAGSAEDPRLFLFTGNAVLSIVTGGDGKDLLEVGELVTPSRTLKAEFKFPVTSPITREAGYAHLDYIPSSTTCGLCHSGEQPHPAHPMARVSLALRPPARTSVTLESARRFASSCDRETQRDRCLRWASVFGFGAVADGAFPPEFGDFIK